MLPRSSEESGRKDLHPQKRKTIATDPDKATARILIVAVADVQRFIVYSLPMQPGEREYTFLCDSCGGEIQLPCNETETVVTCPHCTADVIVAPPQKSNRKVLWLTIGILSAFTVTASLVLVFRKTQRPPPPLKSAPAATKPPTTFHDFEVSDVKLSRESNSTVVYAVATIKNQLDRQRFGVRVHVELLDGSGEKVGTASDYIAAISPKGEWQFRALVVENATVTARVLDITEQE